MITVKFNKKETVTLINSLKAGMLFNRDKRFYERMIKKIEKSVSDNIKMY